MPPCGSTRPARRAVPAGGDPATAAVADTSTAGADGSVTLAPANGWTAGAYDAVLLDPSGEELARSAFWAEAPGQRPVIATGKAVYAVGAPIDVSWMWAPGNRADWVGVYRRHRDPTAAPYLEYIYTKATVQGAGTIDEKAQGKWPLVAGDYTVYLLRDDDYVKLAGADFTIR